MTDAIPGFWQRLCYTPLSDVLRGRFDASLHWQGVVARAGLPESINNTIDQVIRCTRLWRSEKVAVAAELVAHFQDGLEAGQSAEQLVASFGDPQQAAQLIRRAKRRGRSPVWQIWRWACVAVGALVAAYVVMAVYFFAGRPAIKVNYLAILNERAVAAPEDLRAWPVYREALGGLLVDRQWPDWMNEADLTPSSKTWPAAVAWLKKHEAAVAKLREATKLPELGLALGTSPKAFSPADQRLLFDPADPRLEPQFPRKDGIEDQMLISTHLPHLEVLKNAARVVAFDAQRAAKAGDGETALADVRAILAMADHVEQPPLLIGTVLAAKMQSMAYGAVNDVLSVRPDLWSTGQMRDLAHAIAAADIDWQAGFEGNRAMFEDTMQRFYTDDGHGDGHLAFRGPEGLNVFDALARFTGEFPAGSPHNPFAYDGVAAALMPAANMIVASRREMSDYYNEMLDGAIARMDTPLWELPKGRTYVPEFVAEHGTVLKRARHIFVSLMLPAYDAVRNAAAARDGPRDGALVGIALELYHREHQSWPKSLDELSPRWLPEVPVDRINGGPLGYRIVNDRPVVYSLGVDGDDDGGRLPAECDGDATKYRVSSPHAIPANATEHMRGWHDGDWVIWSTVPKK